MDQPPTTGAPASFKQHPLTTAERLWLTEVLTSPRFDARIAKVKLLGKIPDDFDPNSIDHRFYANDRITLLGLWHVDPSNELFANIHTVISAIRARLIDEPGVTDISAPALEKATQLPQAKIWLAMRELQYLGNFFNSAQSAPDSLGVAAISLTTWPTYQEYLSYSGLDTLLERYYRAHDPKNAASRQVIIENFAGFPGAFPATNSLTLVDYPPTQRTPQTIKHNTAFVLMAIDPNMPELEDVYTAIKDVCRLFGITAYRADEIEHQDRITDLILSEIQTCEFLVADLSLARPNVYYEVGFAHAKNKKPILYRRAGTKLHFDLAVHNVPEYRNTTELRDLLRKRLAAILGREPAESGAH